ncbi:indolepyruvate oxidoreductase subunit beta [Ructibacterium gallinarum]|uniref:Indolepyruvate ferredoxin oxidoreductase subunit beta n=1 Tax=Ructibacterium gallinarum TaxID=2779355 RepID=A0A9D5M2V0_9FIRM|nr:indolepyruvate oxidoreductase subunit beta [Ructibacterium gallinarum]MBE5039659.1 indolepyruvate oxidoreductase subunit beta [Ructibacterium gallinarum]
MIVGVGGQGTLLASRILGNLAMADGYDVKVSEVHGMSQRGGSVVTYVKYGEKVYSPIIDQGEADLILAFEELEAYRYLPYLKKGGKIICNAQEIDPMPVITGAMEYPQEILRKIKEKDIQLISVDAAALAMQAGNIKTVNVALIGVLSKSMDVPEENWIRTLETTVPEKALDVNIRAFRLGRELA